MLNPAKPIEQALEGQLPSLTHMLTDVEIKALVKFIRCFSHNWAKNSYLRRKAYDAISPFYGKIYREAFQATVTKYQISERMLTYLINVHSIWAIPTNISGYFHSELIMDYFDEKSRKSLLYRIKRMKKYGYIQEVKNQTFIRDTSANRARKFYVLTASGMRIIHTLRRSADIRIAKFVNRGGDLDVELAEFNHSQNYLTWLVVFFNTQRKKFLKNVFHITHGELEMMVPDSEKIILPDLDRMDADGTPFCRDPEFVNKGRY